MARVLALSSHVAYGSVGLAAIVPALQALGHEVVALPTIVLSNHPGHACFTGVEIAPATLDEILDSLDANGWLSSIDAVLTGYLPTEAHVSVARSAFARVSEANGSAFLVCDPVLGDLPGGLYIDAGAAAATRDHLLPACSLATPNAFELSWLSGEPVETVEDAVVAARVLGVKAVLATSIPAGDDRLATLLVGKKETRACIVPRRETAPHGTGDLLAALYVGHALNGETPDACLARAAAAVEACIGLSAGRNELSLAAAGAIFSQAAGLPTVAV
ncbi:MAG TPA: pyridoxal kinase [Hyphomicrobium sp.]|jgi:pyridoxine kinase